MTRKSGLRQNRSAPKKVHKQRSQASDHGRTMRQERPEKPEGLPDLPGNRLYLYGRNSVEAALKNPQRKALRLFVGDGAQRGSQDDLIHMAGSIDKVGVASKNLNATFPHGTPHQNIVLEVERLAEPDIFDLAQLDGHQLFVMLDQVTDPQNVGACLRSAAALGATALITQDRNSPPETGALARAAAGGLEALPWCKVSNLTRTLEMLGEHGFWSIGLAGECSETIYSIKPSNKMVIVMGSEGTGLRPLVAKTCDQLAAIPMTGKVESLNVSVAAALAIQALTDQS